VRCELWSYGCSSSPEGIRDHIKRTPCRGMKVALREVGSCCRQITALSTGVGIPGYWVQKIVPRRRGTRVNTGTNIGRPSRLLVLEW
jgi:hypothetical protein